jgi:hypothetical protein
VIAPRGLHRAFTDEQLRGDLDADLRPREIAEKYGVSRQAVYKRIGQLEECDVAAACAPAESRRFVASMNDALTEIAELTRRVRLLLDACERELLEIDEGGEATGRYDVGPRAGELMVSFLRVGAGRQKRNLQTLLDIALDPERERFVSAESRFADPRQLLLSASAESRALIGDALRVAEKLADASVVQRVLDRFFSLLERVDAGFAAEIAEEVRRDLVLGTAFRAAAGISARTAD